MENLGELSINLDKINTENLNEFYDYLKRRKGREL